MKDYHINIFYSEADRGYIADIPDLDGCSAFGKTPAEALKQAEVAKRAWLAAARAEKNLFPNRDIALLSIKPAHSLVPTSEFGSGKLPRTSLMRMQMLGSGSDPALLVRRDPDC